MVALDIAEHALCEAGADAGQQTGEGGGHDTGETAPMDGQHDERDDVGKQNRARIEKEFSWNTVIDAIVDVYQTPVALPKAKTIAVHN